MPNSYFFLITKLKKVDQRGKVVEKELGQTSVNKSTNYVVFWTVDYNYRS